MKVCQFLLIVLVVMPLSFSTAATSEQALLQQYELLAPRINSKNNLLKEFSQEEQWQLAQAFYLLRNFNAAKELVSNLARPNSAYRQEALLLQLKIAIITQDAQLNRLINGAKQVNLTNTENLTVATANQWLAQQAPVKSSNWQNIKQDAQELEKILTKAPAYAPERIRAERQLINLYTQANNLVALEQLLERVSLAEDKQHIALNLGILQADNLDIANDSWQKAAEGSLAKHQESAYFLLILSSIKQQNWQAAAQWQAQLQRLAAPSDVRLQILPLYQDFASEESRKLATALNRLIAHRSFGTLPLSLQQQAYAMRAHTRLSNKDKAGAQSDYQWLVNQPNASFNWLFAYITMHKTFAQAQPVERLQTQAKNTKQQHLAQAVFAYHLYLSNQHHALYQLLEKHQQAALEDPFFLIYRATMQQFNQDYHLAARSFAQAATSLEQQPAIHALALMQSAVNHVNAQEMPQANYQLSKLLMIDLQYLNNLDVKFLLAQVLASQSQWLKASELFEQSYQLSLKPIKQIPHLSEIPSYYEISYNYYKTLQQLSDERALAFLEQVALRNAPIASQIQQHYAQELFNQEQYLKAAHLLERNYHQLTTLKKQQPNLLYQSALAYELAANATKAKELFTLYLTNYPNSDRAVATARRVANLMSYNELQNLLFNTNNSTLPIITNGEMHAIFAIVWAQKHPRPQQAMQWLTNANFTQAPTTEQLLRAQFLAQFYQQANNHTLALNYWQEVINLTLSTEDHHQARLQRSAIFESQEDFPAAVNELIQLSNTLATWRQQALAALELAYQLCLRHNLQEPASLIRQRMQNEFNWQE